LTGTFGDALGLAVPPLLEHAAATAEQATSAVTARPRRTRWGRPCLGRPFLGRLCVGCLCLGCGSGDHKREAGPPSRPVPATMSDERRMATSRRVFLMQSRRLGTRQWVTTL